MNDDEVTVTVVLRPAGGGPLEPGGATVDTVAASAPDPQAAAKVQAFFAGLGFEGGPLVANAFSITGPRALAERLGGELPQVGALALDGLPAEIRRHIISVEREPPLDFGPTSFA